MATHNLFVTEIVFANKSGMDKLGAASREMSILPNAGDKVVFDDNFSNKAGVPTDYIWTVKHVVYNFKDEKFQVYVWHRSKPDDWF